MIFGLTYAMSSVTIKTGRLPKQSPTNDWCKRACSMSKLTQMASQKAFEFGSAAQAAEVAELDHLTHDAAQTDTHHSST